MRVATVAASEALRNPRWVSNVVPRSENRMKMYMNGNSILNGGCSMDLVLVVHRWVPCAVRGLRLEETMYILTTPEVTPAAIILKYCTYLVKEYGVTVRLTGCEPARYILTPRYRVSLTETMSKMHPPLVVLDAS